MKITSAGEAIAFIGRRKIIIKSRKRMFLAKVIKLILTLDKIRVIYYDLSIAFSGGDTPPSVLVKIKVKGETK
ncbi:hypothetical protein L6250_00525 [Candidatus Parcubacteria bacterium]|nr:hypothetical protein [Patescibacteria group bacterium]MBU4466875.1 hypothetical protein [Patescibacteria group bacterium]MCG2688113.1 hypothetical protein [Candidatus Parcubacteria bacterium]